MIYEDELLNETSLFPTLRISSILKCFDSSAVHVNKLHIFVHTIEENDAFLLQNS